VRSICVKFMNWLIAAFCCGVYAGGIVSAVPRVRLFRYCCRPAVAKEGRVDNRFRRRR
jgi:hypothetical protein